MGEWLVRNAGKLQVVGWMLALVGSVTELVVAVAPQWHLELQSPTAPEVEPAPTEGA